MSDDVRDTANAGSAWEPRSIEEEMDYARRRHDQTFDLLQEAEGENERLREGIRELVDWLAPHNAKAAQKALDVLGEDYATAGLG